MRGLLSKIYDVLFPPSDDTLIVRMLRGEDTQELFRPTPISYGYALSLYRDVRVRALIHEAKFHQNKQALIFLNTLFQNYLETYNPDIDIIIPVPLSSKRFRERGYNQVEKILSAGNPRTPIETRILRRTKHTKPQTELERSERLNNLRGAFTVTNPERIAGKHVLLVDDVTTTGATFQGTRDALLAASPASVTCVALAH